MTAAGQALVRRHQLTQIRNGGLAAALVMQLGEDLLKGKINRDEFIAGVIAQGRLSHTAAVRLAKQFLTEYHQLEAPHLEHLAPPMLAADDGVALGRAVGTLRDLNTIDRKALGYGDEFMKIIGGLAARQHQTTLDAGRDVIVLSAAANDRRWRRITDGRPCAFCAMLATRTDYTSPFAAQYVVGRGKTTRPGARGRRGLGVRPRGSRSLGEKYHDNCGCTVAEVFDDWEPSNAERQQKALYEEARKACEEQGLEPTTKNILAQMRELGDGTIHDAHVPESKRRKPGRKPKTATGGSGGGRKTPPKGGLGSYRGGDFEAWKRHSLDGASADEIGALRRWTTSEHRKIQEQLRSGRLDEETAMLVRLIDAALSRNPLPVDVELHRRDTLKAFQAANFEEVISQVGRIVDLPAYLALSTRSGGVKTGRDAVVRVHVTVPRGTPAAYIEQVSEKPKQRETLVIHGKLMAVTRAEVVDGALHVWCSLA